MTQELIVPPRFRHDYPSRQWMSRSGPASIDYICELLGIEDMGDVDILDVGCGTKFTESFLNHRKPVGRYVGVDVDAEMIEFLRENVEDPRFEFHHADIRNARYNPDGEKLTESTRLPGTEGRDFDLIWLFSVFTHLDPHDYRAMLHVLRRCIRPDGRLFFSVFLDERSEGGHGLMDSVARALGDEAVGNTEGFRDLEPNNVLAYALYSREYAVGLIDGTGWEVLMLGPPTEFVQHHFTCRPV
jgi:SAM-dependent methyltransferase